MITKYISYDYKKRHVPLQNTSRPITPSRPVGIRHSPATLYGLAQNIFHINAKYMSMQKYIL